MNMRLWWEIPLLTYLIRMHETKCSKCSTLNAEEDGKLKGDKHVDLERTGIIMYVVSCHRIRCDLVYISLHDDVDTMDY